MERVTEPQTAILRSSSGDEQQALEMSSRQPRVDMPPTMRTLLEIFRRELEIAKEGFRFRLVTLLILVLMVVSALISSAQYHAEVASFEDALASYAAELEGSTVADMAASIGHPAIKPPWKLGFLVEGEQLREPNVYRQSLSPWAEPELGRLQAENPRLYAAEPLDWLFVIRVVLSLAAFILGYDAFCGERQLAMLKMSLTYPIARWHLVVAKVAAGWVCLAVPFLVGSLLSLLLLSFYQGLQFDSGDWFKIAAVMSLGLWAAFIFSLVALLVSVASREAARSLAVLVFIWLAAVVIIPAAGSLVVALVRPLPTQLETEQRSLDIRQAVEHAGPGHWRPKELAQQDDFAQERKAAEKQNERFEKQEQLRREVASRRFERLHWTRTLGALLPMVLIQDLAERLVNSGPYRSQSFLEQGWRFRDILAEYTLELDMSDATSPHVHFVKDFLSTEPLDAAEVPRFEFDEPSRRELLERSISRLLALSSMMVLLLIAVLVLFNRKDLQ